MNTLTDCRNYHLQHPDTFGIPSESDIALLQSGDYVKLIFDDQERMWVEVTSRTDDHFEGKIANEPFLLDDMNLGDRICFHAKHICDLAFS